MEIFLPVGCIEEKTRRPRAAQSVLPTLWSSKHTCMAGTFFGGRFVGKMTTCAHENLHALRQNTHSLTHARLTYHLWQ